MRIKRIVAMGVLPALGLTLSSPDAYACEPASNPTLEVADDRTGEAPSAISDVSATIRRGRGPTGDCGRSLSTSCDDMGSVLVYFEPAADPNDDTVGYRVELIEGTAPGYSLMESQGRVLLPALQSDVDGRSALNFYWDDGDTDTQEPLDFTITLTPVDAHGNEGPASDRIHIRDEGSGGCTVGKRRIRSSDLGAVAALGVAGLAVARRGRRRATGVR